MSVSHVLSEKGSVLFISTTVFAVDSCSTVRSLYLHFYLVKLCLCGNNFKLTSYR